MSPQKGVRTLDKQGKGSIIYSPCVAGSFKLESSLKKTCPKREGSGKLFVRSIVLSFGRVRKRRIDLRTISHNFFFLPKVSCLTSHAPPHDACGEEGEEDDGDGGGDDGDHVEEVVPRGGARVQHDGGVAITGVVRGGGGGGAGGVAVVWKEWKRKFLLMVFS